MKLLTSVLVFLTFSTFWESSVAFWGWGRKKPTTTTTEKPIATQVDLLPEPGRCGISLQNKIYGGKKAEITDFPWMVQIGYAKPNNKTGYHCGGVLISDQYVLTASHCVNGISIPDNWNLNTVRLGEWDTETEKDCDEINIGESICSPPVVDVSVVERIPHENYDKDSEHQYHDIALLRLGEKVPFTRFVSPICIAKSQEARDRNLTDLPMETAGWGKTEKGLSKSNFKLKVILDGVTLDSCQKIYKQMEVELKNGQMCAGGKQGKDSCSGDSGGPLMAIDETDPYKPFYYLAGIVSFGPIECGMEGWPGVYTRTGEYLEWIQNNMKE